MNSYHTHWNNQQDQVKKDILAFKIHESVQFVGWYIQTNPTTTVKKSAYEKFENPAFLDGNPDLAKNFNF